MSRRLVLVLALVLFAPLAEAQGLVRAVGPIGMTVSDMERSIAFYSRITTLRAATGPGVEFLEYLTPRDGRPALADAPPERRGPLAD
jgi:hypothetical protein